VGKVSIDQSFQFSNIVFVSCRKFGPDRGIKGGGLSVIDSTEESRCAGAHTGGEDAMNQSAQTEAGV